MNLFKVGCFAVVFAAVLIGFLVFPLLPDVVPIHWGVSGQADDFGPSWFGAFIFPLILAVVLLILVLVPKVAVFKKNFEAFERQYWMLGYVLMLFFILFFALTLLPNFGYVFNMSQVIGLPLGMLFISIGILMPSFKRNFFVGIRTPWSLANDVVWEKTHRFGGKAFILAGLAVLFSIPFPEATIFVSVAAILLAVLAPVVYSFLAFRKNSKVRL